MILITCYCISLTHNDTSIYIFIYFSLIMYTSNGCMLHVNWDDDCKSSFIFFCNNSDSNLIENVYTRQYLVNI